jgi:hypothetical protein
MTLENPAGDHPEFVARASMPVHTKIVLEAFDLVCRGMVTPFPCRSALISIKIAAFSGADGGLSARAAIPSPPRNQPRGRAFTTRQINEAWRLDVGRGLLLWLIGIPLPIILVIWLFGGLS